MLDETVDAAMDMYLTEGVEPAHWNLEGFKNYFIGMIAGDLLDLDEEALAKVDRAELAQKIKDKVMDLYHKREEELTEPVIRELERVVLLKQVDTKWMDHIDAMDELKKGIYLRSYGQKDPVVEYRMEGFDMFDEMVAGIREETVKILLLAPFRRVEQPVVTKVTNPAQEAAQGEGQAEAPAQEEAPAQQPKTAFQMPKREQVAVPTGTSSDGTLSPTTVKRQGKKVGRNDPCPCGSGKKYKKCCGK